MRNSNFDEIFAEFSTAAPAVIFGAVAAEPPAPLATFDTTPVHVDRPASEPLREQIPRLPLSELPSAEEVLQLQNLYNKVFLNFEKDTLSLISLPRLKENEVNFSMGKYHWERAEEEYRKDNTGQGTAVHPSLITSLIQF